MEYLVKWTPAADGTEYEPTWEPKENISLALVKAYHGLTSLEPILVKVWARHEFPCAYLHISRKSF